MDIRGIPFSLEQAVDFRSSSDEILALHSRHAPAGLIAYFHGHPVLISAMERFGRAPASPPPANVVAFDLDTQNNIILESHGLKITEYMIWVTYDYFVALPIKEFVEVFPDTRNLEFRDRADMTWEQVCAFEARIYSPEARQLVHPEVGVRLGDAAPSPSPTPDRSARPPGGFAKTVNPSELQEYFDAYTLNIYDQSRRFCDALARCLPGGAKILDLGGSNCPWFAIAMAERGFPDVTVYDIGSPWRPRFLEKLGIRYVQASVTNFAGAAGSLGRFDFIYCRNLSPAQKLVNFFDRGFMDFWNALLDTLTDRGLLYWIQMSNGTGRPDSFFAHRSMSYIQEFLKRLNANAELTKYGYIRILANNGNRQLKTSLLAVAPTKSLVAQPLSLGQLAKHFAYQLQDSYRKLCVDLNNPVQVAGPRLGAVLVKVLLEDNFRFANVRIARNESDDLQVVFGTGETIRLTPPTSGTDDFFLIDEQEDARFNQEFAMVAERTMQSR